MAGRRLCMYACMYACMQGSGLRPLGLWESLYPTSFEACVAPPLETGVKAHYLVVFFLAQL
jgi:hypothetical protein